MTTGVTGQIDAVADPGGASVAAAPRVSNKSLTLNGGPAPWTPVQHPRVNRSWIRPWTDVSLHVMTRMVLITTNNNRPPWLNLISKSEVTEKSTYYVQNQLYYEHGGKGEDNKNKYSINFIVWLWGGNCMGTDFQELVQALIHPPQL